MSEHNSEDLINVVNLAPAEVSEIDLYQKREKIYTREIEGFFQRVRLFTGWPLLVGYFVLPWTQWDGRQAVLFDLPARKFYVFGLTFWPQDFSLLAWTLALAAFSLFFVTTLFGRVWCGYSCPQTVWTSMYMWAEQKTEGSRNQRIRLDKAPWTLSKLRKKASKHAIWLFIAYSTGFTFVAYFVPAYDLSFQAITFDFYPWALFWIAFFTLSTYINAGWMREQLCMYMCPYARFQSVMFDSNTLVVTYDQERGEPRGSRKRGSLGEKKTRPPEEAKTGLGACIDCELCKQVCPTGIDIRDGLQYQCIGCALCIDACNSVMDKMGYQRDLISYSTENQAKGEKLSFIRPKVVGYAAAIFVMSTLMLGNLYQRIPLQLDVIRDRNQLYQLDSINSVDSITNSYTIKILNKDQADHRYTVSIDGLDNASFLDNSLAANKSIYLRAGDLIELPVTLYIAKGSIQKSTQSFNFVIHDHDDPSINTRHETRFIGPTVH